MLCDKCGEREATVHLTLCKAEDADIGKRHFCELCFPAGTTSNEKMAAGLLRFFGLPPDGGVDGQNPEGG